MIELYLYSKKDEPIDSPRYGVIPYFEWLHREKDFIQSAPGRTAEVREYGNEAALFVNDVCPYTFDGIKDRIAKRRKDEVSAVVHTS